MRKLFVCGLVALFLSACAQVPKESIELGENVGNILNDLRVKNANLIALHFQSQKDRINRFVDDIYAPQVIAEAMRDPNVNVLQELTDYVQAGKGDDVIGLMEIMVRLSMERVDDTRRGLLAPIELQEREVKAAFDQAFGAAIKGNETTTGILRSVVAVHETQNLALERVGLGGLREQVSNEAASVSNMIANLNTQAGEIEAILSKDRSGANDFEKANDIVQELRNLVNNTNGQQR